jgi:hypothetical protein
VVALIDYVSGFPCLSVTPFVFYSEQTATLLRALDRCRQSGRLDEIECCLLHALEPGRSLVFDWLVDAGFAHSEDGHWLVWRSRRVEGARTGVKVDCSYRNEIGLLSWPKNCSQRRFGRGLTGTRDKEAGQSPRWDDPG